MKYLLDTHAFIWTLMQKEYLSDQVQEVIEDPGNEILVSALSFWEISLKYALKKLDIKGLSPEDLPDLALKTGFTMLPLLAAESASYHQLPSFGDHKDPFDRMLIWQAVTQGITLISKDATMEQYKSIGLRLLW